MTFRFDVWEHSLGNPDEILDVCRWVNAELPRLKSRATARHDGPEIVFRIVDVRPGAYAEDDVRGLIDKLTRLMLADPELIRSVESHAQLLFVGATPSLGNRAKDEWAEDDGLRRDLKRDTEFAIRTLRGYRVALYGCVDALVDADHALERLPLACSAIRLFERLYRAPPGGDPRRRGWPNPGAIDSHAALGEIRADFDRLLATARALPEFKRVGSDDTDTQHPLRRNDLLREIGLLYELGKGERPLPFSPQHRLSHDRRLTLNEPEAAHSSYQLFVDSLDKIARWVPDYRPSPPAVRVGSQGRARQRLEHDIALDIFKLERFNLLRDIGRVLGQGALKGLRELGGGTPRLLAIDDWLFDTLSKERARLEIPGRQRPPRNAKMMLVDRLRCALAAAWPTGAHAHVVRSASIDANGEFGAAHFRHILNPTPRADGGPAVLALDGAPCDWEGAPEDYAVVLIDPESTTDGLGAIRVHRLAKYFEQIGRAPPVVAGAPRSRPRQTPPIIAYQAPHARPTEWSDPNPSGDEAAVRRQSPQRLKRG